MVKEALAEIFERDLKKLAAEINLYKNENTIWKIEHEISNSAGNLCLHLIGNLNHFVGAILGKSGYERNRDSEFSLKNVPRNELIQKIDDTILVVKNTLNQMNDEDFQNKYPLDMQGRVVKTDFMLLHLLAHFNYHLGQVNYHRRLIK
jgi:uncharacterized damage-inducible protein DinB